MNGITDLSNIYLLSIFPGGSSISSEYSGAVTVGVLVNQVNSLIQGIYLQTA